MAIVAFISQKGGVGKSTLARGLAREAAHSGLTVKLADLDTQQSTSTDWHRLRLAQNGKPAIPVQAYPSVAVALRDARNFDYFVIDAPARASKGTLEIAGAADLVVQPTGASLDDLRPAIRVFHEFKASGIRVKRMHFALCRIGTPAEEADARAFLEDAGYLVLPGCLLERPAYRAAQGIGKPVTETKFATLNKRAGALISAIARSLEDAETEEATKKPVRRSAAARR